MPKNRNKPPEDFIRHSPGLSIKAAQQAWYRFQKWQRDHRTEHYRQFWAETSKLKDEIRTKLDAIENPFANGKKGEPYRIEFSLPDYIRDFKFHESDLTAAGLKIERIDGQRCIICGTPAQAGNFGIRFACGLPGRLKPRLVRTFLLLINPDPQDLWQDIPSDQAQEYARPDLASAILRCSGAKIWAASRRGRSHAHCGKPRDDAFELGFYDGWHIIALADGAGSAPFSRKGAELACATAMEASKAQLAQATDLEQIFSEIPASLDQATWLTSARKAAWYILPQAAFAARKAILHEASLRGREPRGYATTLLLAMAKKYPGGWAVMSFQIGDGAMALLSSGKISLLAEPDEGEFSGQTRFVTMDEVFDARELMRRLRIDFTNCLDCLILMTDGVSDPLFPGSADLHDQKGWFDLLKTLNKIGASNQPDKELLDWLSFQSRGNHDDRTLAALIPENGQDHPADC